MKKKWIVIIGIITIIVAAGGLTAFKLINQDKNLEAISHTQEWVLDAKEIKKIDVNGLDQDLTIELSQSEEPKTRVNFTGETTPDLKTRMEKIKNTADKLDLDLMQKGLSISIKGKATTLKGKLQIILGKDVTLKELKQTSIFSDTLVTLPVGLAVKTYPKTKDGQIKTVADAPEAQTVLKISSESGNITIQRR